MQQRAHLAGFVVFAGVVTLALSCAFTGRAHAQAQFVLIDETFTATAQNTDKSQYPITPLPAQPDNWLVRTRS